MCHYRLFFTIKISFSLETQEVGSVNFSENMTAAIEMDVHRVFMFAGSVDETQVIKFI